MVRVHTDHARFFVSERNLQKGVIPSLLCWIPVSRRVTLRSSRPVCPKEKARDGPPNFVGDGKRRSYPVVRRMGGESHTREDTHFSVLIKWLGANFHVLDVPKHV
jgi:hypothetical protein